MDAEVIMANPPAAEVTLADVDPPARTHSPEVEDVQPVIADSQPAEPAVGTVPHQSPEPPPPPLLDSPGVTTLVSQDVSEFAGQEIPEKTRTSWMTPNADLQESLSSEPIHDSSGIVPASDPPPYPNPDALPGNDISMDFDLTSDENLDASLEHPAETKHISPDPETSVSLAFCPLQPDCHTESEVQQFLSLPTGQATPRAQVDVEIESGDEDAEGSIVDEESNEI
ncbi:hypothetical protein BD311DRAFT_770956 [Dichomitus squalens]|uniref:Uncharacterized protein n=1 Tax=Dichomitus squalens TaxID=114155 RepID=A0A4Q9M933_9APHY|nr:hypothetical protein BD311DRAFT_770956 [Dichomitus squalens]